MNRVEPLDQSIGTNSTVLANDDDSESCKEHKHNHINLVNVEDKKDDGNAYDYDNAETDSVENRSSVGVESSDSILDNEGTETIGSIINENKDETETVIESVKHAEPNGLYNSGYGLQVDEHEQVDSNDV